jgi:hypothetical protein
MFSAILAGLVSLFIVVFEFIAECTSFSQHHIAL